MNSLHKETKTFFDPHFIEEASRYDGLTLARVISHHKNVYRIITATAEYWAVLAGKRRYSIAHREELPAVGDYVMVRTDETDSERVPIEAILERKSVFKRAAVGGDEQAQVISANSDILFICMALNEDYNINRLERYLSVAWDSGAKPLIVLTKTDLCNTLEEIMQEISSVAFGVDVVTTSHTEEESFENLRRFITQGITASFVGSSGVGKSTIVNYLLGRSANHTAEIRQDGKGRHTTTHRELFILENGGALIDTPGMRELGIDSADLSKSFSDIEELAATCRFNNCRHESEPGCAIKDALGKGLLDKRRFENYQKLKKEMNYEGMNSKQIEEAKIHAMVGGFKEMKKMRSHYQNKHKQRS